MLPGINKQLDFTAHHIYPTERRAAHDGLPNFCLHNHSASMNLITVFDRLRASTASNPGPVCLGEFGTSTGHFYRSSLAPGSPGNARRYASFRTQALYDTAAFVYAFTSGSGGALHWRLNDHPLAFAVVQSSYIGDDAVPSDHAKYISEGEFGLHWYDGVTAAGRRKPLAEAMSFLGPYLAAHADEYRHYDFFSWDAPSSPIHLEWNVSGPAFLACGCSRLATPGLSLVSEDSDGVVVFADWGNGRTDAALVALFAASDVQVRLVPAALSPPVAIQPTSAKITGKHGAVTVEGGALVIELLQGEEVKVEPGPGLEFEAKRLKRDD